MELCSIKDINAAKKNENENLLTNVTKRMQIASEPGSKNCYKATKIVCYNSNRLETYGS